MLESLVVPTFIVAIAEIGDKSQLVCMTLAARHRGLPVVIGATAAFAVLNLLVAVYIFTLVLIYTLASFGTNILTGYTGLVSLGHAAFYGIGAGLILNGELYTGGNGNAGEIGHIPAVADGEPCPCGNRGCLERYLSLEAFERRGLPVSEVERLVVAHTEGRQFGLFGEPGRAAQTGIVLGVFALQIGISHAWLSHHRYGPMEWTWRWLTYGRRPGWRRIPALP